MEDSTKVILIIDDEEMITEPVSALLEDHKYKVLIANSGKEAIKIYTDNKDIIDLVLLDLNMPDMNGYEVLPILIKINNMIPIVVSSGFHQSSLKTLKSFGAIDCINKPFEEKELVNKIETILKK